MAPSSSSRNTIAPRRVVMRSDKLPVSLRLRIWASQYLWPGRNRGGMGNVVRLPFKKVIKLNASRNEVEAMEYVRTNTSVPMPKVYKVYERPDGAFNILMEQLPGNGTDYASMSPEQVRAFGDELAGYLNQLRSLKPPEEGFIGSIDGKSLMDHRIGNLHFGPFHNVDDFHSYLRLGGRLDEWMYDPVVKTIHGKSNAYRVKFTHADLNPTNIQYHNGRIRGIIDWETAGWYPEYWEYTKMWFAYRPPFEPFFKAVEGNPNIDKYPEELKAERDIWRRLSPWAYDSFYEQPKNVAAFYEVINAGKSQNGDDATGDSAR
ncbi:aminoglycoside 3'-phosphotransferase/choline kinase domain protein [Metarhizium robertsii]|uniref:Protein kinase-like protein n=2 Tax=Metarhizium robertsii TaxID=568076 RepID=E9ETI3_METRA|nr:Protein kinase-like protein [Metarhizium robertsii ARSEF 23]EFZ00736.1 Protein kinase-like protein [Metarhizium robertsii ARSEF 23]EXV03249.1 aminoglycoside 3'-phosphotransferase/choline kinase domain protein [Metarhizium robertsii]